MNEPGTDLVLPGGGEYREWFIDQFLSKAVIGGTDECWVWKGHVTHGYGYLIKQRKKQGRDVSMRVHRLSYELANKVVLDRSQYVHHRCANRGCYNPTHLSLTDAHRHMSDHHMLTHCKRGHEFTLENTYYHKSGKSIQRRCRECELEKKRREHYVRYHGDPEYRAKKQARNREGYHRRKGSRA